jgi:hypothetical protein
VADDDDVEILGQIDFSAFHQIGTYRVSVGGRTGEVSIHQSVGDDHDTITEAILRKVYRGEVEWDDDDD